MLSLLFSFNGRINRSKYWGTSVALGFANFVANMTSMMMGTSATLAKTTAEKINALAGQSLIMLPVFALLVWCGLAIQVKRFHDRGRTGWWSAAPFVAMILLICSVVGSAFSNAPIEKMLGEAAPYFWLLTLIMVGSFIDLACMPSAEGPNKYGDPPGASGISTPTPQPQPGGSPAASTLFGAQSAMDRAIAAQDSMRTAPVKSGMQPRPSMPPRHPIGPTPAPAGGGGFGRRPTS